MCHSQLPVATLRSCRQVLTPLHRVQSTPPLLNIHPPLTWPLTALFMHPITLLVCTEGLDMGLLCMCQILKKKQDYLNDKEHCSAYVRMLLVGCPCTQGASG